MSAVGLALLAADVVQFWLTGAIPCEALALDFLSMLRSLGLSLAGEQWQHFLFFIGDVGALYSDALNCTNQVSWKERLWNEKRLLWNNLTTIGNKFSAETDSGWILAAGLYTLGALFQFLANPDSMTFSISRTLVYTAQSLSGLAI